MPWEGAWNCFMEQPETNREMLKIADIYQYLQDETHDDDDEDQSDCIQNESRLYPNAIPDQPNVDVEMT